MAGLEAENVLKKSDSKSRLVRDSTVTSTTVTTEKESLCGSGSSSDSSESLTSSPSKIESLFLTCKVKSRANADSTEDKKENSTPGDPIQTKLTPLTSLIVEPRNTTAGVTGAVAMLDRKRKERHESTSQEQETKVIRGNDPELNSQHIIDLGEGRNPEKFVQPNINKETVPDTPVTNHENSDCLSFMKKNETENTEMDESEVIPPTKSSSLYGYGHGVRTMPTNFEAEKQRQWERTAAQWNSRKIRKPHQHRSRQGKSSKSFSEVENIIYPTATATTTDHQFENLTISPVKDSESLARPTMSFPESDNSSPNEEVEKDLASDSKNLATKPHPSFDFLTLRHRMDSQEPLTSMFKQCSSDQVMLSPRNSMMRTDTMDPSVAPSPPLYQIPVDPPFSRQILDGNQDTKINALTRQLASLKKQLRMLEEEYELLMGYKPSHADKLNNKEMKKHLLQLSKLKRELKQIREDPSSLQNSTGNVNLLGVYKNVNPGPVDEGNKEKSLENLEDTVKHVEKMLQESRRIAKRPEDLLRMTHSELLREKASMQKELITLEKKFGRPESKEEKEIVRTLYDRYRVVKKMTGRISFSTVKENSLDLAPILEHETLDLQTESDVPRISVMNKELITSPKASRRHFGHGDDNEDYNDMDTCELEMKYKMATDEKRKLRMTLRRFEADFQNQTGRLPQKEDKYGSGDMELVYQKYKHIRGKVRLLDVLINKRKFPHTLVDLTKIEVED